MYAPEAFVLQEGDVEIVEKLRAEGWHTQGGSGCDIARAIPGGLAKIGEQSLSDWNRTLTPAQYRALKRLEQGKPATKVSVPASSDQDVKVSINVPYREFTEKDEEDIAKDPIYAAGLVVKHCDDMPPFTGDIKLTQHKSSEPCPTWEGMKHLEQFKPATKVSVSVPASSDQDKEDRTLRNVKVRVVVASTPHLEDMTPVQWERPEGACPVKYAWNFPKEYDEEEVQKWRDAWRVANRSDLDEERYDAQKAGLDELAAMTQEMGGYPELDAQNVIDMARWEEAPATSLLRCLTLVEEGPVVLLAFVLGYTMSAMAVMKGGPFYLLLFAWGLVLHVMTARQAYRRRRTRSTGLSAG